MIDLKAKSRLNVQFAISAEHSSFPPMAKTANETEITFALIVWAK
jgi:hypothetical protein